VASVLLIATLGARCEAPDLLPPDRNRPPETHLTRGPEEQAVSFYQAHLYWKGFDADGTVSEWQYAIDDTIIRPDAVVVGTGWLRTTKTDSVFIFLASANGTDQQRDHTFFLASIDNEGKADPTPSILNFTARTVSYPIPEVVFGPAEGETLDVFSDVRLCWGGIDPDGRIVKMSYKLDPLDIGFRTVAIEAESCAVYENLPSNGSRESYHFLLVAEDDAGSRNIQPVERRFVVNHDPNTSIIQFYSQSLHGRGDDPEIVPGDTIPDSSSVEFRWEADDVDGAIRGSFWAISGLNLFSSPNLRDSADVRSAVVDRIVSDQNGAYLIVGSVDEYDRAEGSPDTIPFFVNFPPSVTITKPSTFVVSAPDGRVTLAWLGEDRDGRVQSIDYDVEFRPNEGTPQTFTIEADLPDSLTFTSLTPGLYSFTVTPTDRRGEGKFGATAVKTISVSGSGASGTARRGGFSP